MAQVDPDAAVPRGAQQGRTIRQGGLRPMPLLDAASGAAQSNRPWEPVRQNVVELAQGCFGMLPRHCAEFAATRHPNALAEPSDGDTMPGVQHGGNGRVEGFPHGCAE